eukprot:2938622-Amphidinium_carterae.1
MDDFLSKVLDPYIEVHKAVIGDKVLRSCFTVLYEEAVTTTDHKLAQRVQQHDVKVTDKEADSIGSNNKGKPPSHLDGKIWWQQLDAYQSVPINGVPR